MAEQRITGREGLPEHRGQGTNDVCRISKGGLRVCNGNGQYYVVTERRRGVDE